jgi:hypothetical protein
MAKCKACGGDVVINWDAHKGLKLKVGQIVETWACEAGSHFPYYGQLLKVEPAECGGGALITLDSQPGAISVQWVKRVVK